MIRKIFLLIVFAFSLNHTFAQAPGVLDAHFISERYSSFKDNIDIGDKVWEDFLLKRKNGELKLEKGQDTLFSTKRQHHFYPYILGIPYLHLFYEDDHWAVRVYKTVNLETACHGLFGDKGPARHKYIREEDKSIRTDTIYNQLGNTIFKEIIYKGIKSDNITAFSSIWFDQILTPNYYMDTIARDSLADLLKIANKIVVKEDYYYDKYSGETGSQIIALGFYNNEQSLFWTYYPEVSYTLRNSFMLFDRNLGTHLRTSYDELFKSNSYDIESISFSSHKINESYEYNYKKRKADQHHATEMNALFYVSLVRSYVYSNYRNYSGSIKLNVHDNLVLSAQLETGQIQGTCSLIDQSEQPVVQIIFKNNIPHGAYTEYWPNGKIKEKGMFELGLKEGEWLNYFSDGKPMAERNYARGWMNGEQTFWYQNKKKFMTFNYAEFMLNGPFLRFNEKGDLMESGFFTNNYPDGNWNINLFIPKEYVDVVMNNKDLDWEYPATAFEDGILSYDLVLEQGAKPTNCPSPVFTCVSLVKMSEVR